MEGRMETTRESAFGDKIEPGLLDGILDGSPVPTFVIDQDHVVTHWNHACELVLGYPATQMLGTRDQWKAFYPVPRPVMADLVVSGELDAGVGVYYGEKYRRSSIIPGSYEAEDFFPHIGPDGTWLYFTAAPLRNAAGHVIGAIETLQDISARCRADEALRREHQILHAIIEHFPSGISVMDRNRKIIKHNEQFRRMLTVPDALSNQADGMEEGARCDAECGEYGMGHIEPCVAEAMEKSRDPAPYCFEQTRPDGTVLEIKGTPLPDGGFVSSYTDISARKNSEARIRKLLEEQRLIFDNVHVGIAWVRERRIISCNKRLADMFLFADPAQLEGQITRIFHDSDEQWQQIGCAIYADLEHKGSAQSEYEMRRRDGSPIWIMLTGRPLDQRKVNEGSIWVYTDVTAKHLQEAQLRLAERVFAHTSEALLITDRAGKIVNVNRAFTEVTGYEPEEVIGLTPSILKSSRHDKEFFREMWASAAEHGFWEGEVWDRRKNGQIYPKWLSITVVRNADGEIINYIGSFSDITERKATQDKIQFLAHHDPLTSLPNRLLLRDRFNHLMEQVRRSGRSVAFMFLDLDHFKRINDSLGHQIGDQLLIAVVKCLRGHLREGDTLSRQGGDEFILILDDVKGREGAAQRAERIIAALDQPFQIGPHVLTTSVSIGIVMAPQDGDDFDVLMQKADTAMYVSKERARGTYSFFHPSMDERARHRLNIANSLRHALQSEEFELLYQPQIYADSGRTFGAEALLRWHPKGRQTVSPVEFIPVAEEIGVILPLGEWVIEQACEQARRWRDVGLVCRIAVNVSGVQIYRSDLVAILRRAAHRAGISPELIQIELTESTLMDDSILVQDVIGGLKAIGATVAIDDFGTGYSSLAYLKRFRVDKLKIDQGFISDICINEESAAITRAVISIAQSLNIRAIAEGVENARQLDFIRQAGCNEIQGHYYSPPLSTEDFFKYADLRKRI